MKNAFERETDFRKDLESLLKKHGAELEITDDGKPYGMSSPIVIISMVRKYDWENDNLDCDFCEFEL